MKFDILSLNPIFVYSEEEIIDCVNNKNIKPIYFFINETLINKVINEFKSREYFHETIELNEGFEFIKSDKVNQIQFSFIEGTASRDIIIAKMFLLIKNYGAKEMFFKSYSKYLGCVLNREFKVSSYNWIRFFLFGYCLEYNGPENLHYMILLIEV